MSEHTAAPSRVVEAREVVQAAGKMLSDFLKAGPRLPHHISEMREAIAATVSSILTTPETATENYAAACRDFLEEVKHVRGMPFRAISGDAGSDTDTVSSSGDHIARNFPALLPSIMERFDWCIKNYGMQSKLYLDEQLAQFHAMVSQFLEQVPTGGSKDKAIRSRISEIKSELRSLIKWDRLFYTYKAMSFPSEVEYIFALEGNPIAAIWHYNSADEQGEYGKTYNHKQRDGRAYAVRRNWAFDKALMKVGPDGYLDEISHPCQEIGCMCSLQWLYGIRRLPSDMLTEKGCSELARVTVVVQTEGHPPKPNIPAKPGTGRSALKNRLLGWLGRG